MHPGYSQDMRAVWLEPSEEYLRDRERMGGGRRDEVWDGVLHMVPEPTLTHTDFEFELRTALRPIAARRGLRDHQQAPIRDPAGGCKNYRKPDVCIVAPDQENDAAVDGAAVIAIEVLSPNDESRDKLPFYASRGVQEVWLIHPRTRVVEVFTLVGTSYEAVPAIRGIIAAPALGITLEVIEGPKLRIRDAEYVADV